MGEIIPKGLNEILNEDASLTEKITYKEFIERKTVPTNSDKTVKLAYDNYKKIKSGN